jgi:peptide/nickel transport system permease protein
MCWNLVCLDFGESQTTKQRVITMLREGFLPSLALTVPLFIIEEIVAIVLALLAAYYRDSWLDRFFVVAAVAGMSISSLVYIMVAQYWLASEWRWFPVWGFEGPQYLLLPVIIGVVAGIGGAVRFYRTVMLDEVNQDYVRTARAKGVGERSLLFRHVLRNAMIPILTNVVVAIPFLYTGSLLLESFFGIPGLGRMTVTALFNGDEDVIIASVFIGSILFVIANLVTDIAYTWADPRIRLK